MGADLQDLEWGEQDSKIGKKVLEWWRKGKLLASSDVCVHGSECCNFGMFISLKVTCRLLLTTSVVGKALWLSDYFLSETSSVKDYNLI